VALKSHAGVRPARGADIFGAGHSARGAGAVGRKLARENRHSEAHRVGRIAGVYAPFSEVLVRTPPSGLRRPRTKHDIRDEEENLISLHQVGHQAVAAMVKSMPGHCWLRCTSGAPVTELGGYRSYVVGQGKAAACRLVVSRPTTALGTPIPCRSGSAR